jgi:hypothetical protein
MLEKYIPLAQDMRRLIGNSTTFPKESVYRGAAKRMVE